MSYFVEAYTKHYGDFAGRARRKEYWQFVLAYVLVCFALLVIEDFLLEPAERDKTIYFMPLLFQLASMIPILAITTRRMHDVGKSGWFQLIPFYNLVLAVTAGEPRPNQYGPDPKA